VEDAPWFFEDHRYRFKALQHPPPWLHAKGFTTLENIDGQCRQGTPTNEDLKFIA